MGKKENVELVNAVFDMDFEKVKQALERGADVNYVIENPEDDGLNSEDVPEKSTALLLAAENNEDPRILQLLIEKGANLTVRNSNGSTVLMMGLCSRSDKTHETLKILLDQKLVVESINTLDDENSTALHIALFHFGDVDSAKFLLARGADPTIKDDKNQSCFDSPFFIAHPGLIDIYLKKNIISQEIASGEQGIRLLDIALSTRNKKLLDQLFDLGLTKKITSLKISKVIDYLLELIKTGDSDSYSFLESVVVRLDKKDQKKLNKAFKKRNIDLVYESVKHNKLALIQSLQSIGENLTGKYSCEKDSSKKESLLHLAVKKNHLEMLEFLIKQGLDPNVLDDVNQTPFTAGLLDHSKDITLERLIQQGADTSIPTPHGDTPLHIAQVAGRESIVKLLQEDKQREKREKSNHFIQNTQFIKKMGHALGVNLTVVLDMGFQGKKGEVTAESTHPLLSLENLLEFINLYINTVNHPKNILEDLKTIQEALINSTEYVRFNGTKTAEDMANLYKKGEFVIVPSGWGRHVTTEVFYKDYLIDSNRGTGMSVTGTLIRKIQDKTGITGEYISKLKQTGEDLTQITQTQNLMNLAKAVDIRNYEDALPTKGQKWGTCSFANLKSSIMGMLYLLKLEKLQQQSPPQAGSLLSGFAAKRNAEFKMQALEYARKEYKKLTNYIRHFALDELLKTYQNASANPERQDIAYSLILKYIFLHHGQSLSSSHPRLEKRNSEISRLKYIFQSLSEKDQKKLLVDLGKCNLMLFEIASKSPDTAYAELLSDQWPVNIKDILTQRDAAGMTSLIRSVINGTYKEVEPYMKFRGAEWLNIQDPKTGYTALHSAINGKDIKKVEILANHPDIDLTLKDKNGTTAFALAAAHSNAEMMKIISIAEEKQRQARADLFKP